ncbi:MULTISPECIES: hypothetical protein [Rhodococcus]|uniref:Uncharacterized protein n=2 Tax=Rhodococcus opacus TaxID=37919 RepID=C1BC65_RHOOB|nr:MULTISPECIES: hypothetical protein [Rhodococcus]HJT96476.1 hypothetical protein [Mycobacterium sp.]EID79053.1 hypothetical protein W59_15391 [Rhodococcus opacus RKJ300 = JCM 13270]KAF0960452.1 hypothetical protein MLGJGCBP_06467 [Rhodococcus sp. T7]QQZ18304.1 hypothetical protein GO592_39480 [Rhodococcus sp. 21391]UOT08241.1 hypothetical protein MPY17_38600 [Rhodococcus opacus]
MRTLAIKLGDRTVVFEAGVTDDAAITAAADVTAERFGGIDVTIGVAFVGVAFVGPCSPHLSNTSNAPS